MHNTIDGWLDGFATLTDEARASQQFQDWLDVRSRFHDYSIATQVQTATVAIVPTEGKSQNI